MNRETMKMDEKRKNERKRMTFAKARDIEKRVNKGKTMIKCRKGYKRRKKSEK